MDGNIKLEKQLKLCKSCKYAAAPTDCYPHHHCTSEVIICGTHFEDLYDMGLAKEGIHFK